MIISSPNALSLCAAMILGDGKTRPLLRSFKLGACRNRNGALVVYYWNTEVCCHQATKKDSFCQIASAIKDYVLRRDRR